MIIHLKILKRLLEWFHERYYQGRMGGEAGNALETTKALVDQIIKDKWRRKL
uniref:Uncharacterized protein n=1 Tax=viral metagenome TaxID=1070528 RepID=A0A6H1ZQK0_9ZZZZ